MNVYRFSLPISAGALYVHKYFNDESKKAAVDLVSNIRDEFTNMLHDVRWMDDETKNAAMKKAEAIRSFVAYPDDADVDAELLKYFNGLELKSNDFFKNYLRVSNFNEFKRHEKLHQPVDEGNFIIRSKTALVNAFFSTIENSICM